MCIRDRIQVDERRLDQIIGEKVVHQGICALLSEIPFVEVEEILAMAREREEAPLLVAVSYTHLEAGKRPSLPLTP